MKERFELMFMRRKATTVLAAAALFSTVPATFALNPAPSPAQAAAAGQEQTASVHGHVQNAAGQPITAGQIKFTTDVHAEYKDQKFTNTVNIGSDGNYAATGLKPGEYFAYVVVGDKTADQQHFTVKPGDNIAADFDMTRADYIARMTPEEKKALEEFKSKNAAAVASNKQVANLNATITAVRTDIKSASPNFDKDIADMKSATDQRPTEGLLWAVQGEVYQAQAKHQAAADRANKTSPAQDEVVKTAYTNSSTAFQKAADLLGESKPPKPDQQASAYNQLGSVYGDAGKATEASAAFEKAAQIDQAKAAMYYTNEAITFDHNGGGDNEAKAADKAIAADPNKPLPYYLKGQALLAKATVDSKGQVLPPPGCVDAYQKYLQLAPDGPQAPAVKQVLESMGQKIENRYKAGGKR